MCQPAPRRFPDPLSALTALWSTALLLLAAPSALALQSAGPGTPRWTIDLSTSGSSDLDLRSEAFADENVVAGFDYRQDMVQVITPQAYAVNPLIGGTSYGAALNVQALQERFIPLVGLAYSRASSRPMLLVYGIDTDTLTIVWVNTSRTRARVVLVLREDYLGTLQELTGHIPIILEQRYRLTEFDEQQAHAALRAGAG
jgi:hypothetical protein